MFLQFQYLIILLLDFQFFQHFLNLISTKLNDIESIDEGIQNMNFLFMKNLLEKLMNFFDNDNVEILSQIGEIYFLMNNYSRALQYFDKALQINSNHINSLEITKKIKDR